MILGYYLTSFTTKSSDKTMKRIKRLRNKIKFIEMVHCLNPLCIVFF